MRLFMRACDFVALPSHSTRAEFANWDRTPLLNSLAQGWRDDQLAVIVDGELATANLRRLCLAELIAAKRINGMTYMVEVEICVSMLTETVVIVN